jgi:hypothetical protein
MTIRMVATALVLLLVVPLCLSGQTDQTGVIDGRIVSAEGQSMTGVEVVAAQPDGSFRRQTITRADGRFRIGFLPPGSYNVEVRFLGYRTVRVEGIPVRAGDASTVTVTLEPEAIALEEIRVQAGTQMIDRQTSELASTLSAEEIDVLPTPRVATGLINLVPGARPGTIWGGSTSQSNAYQIDGVSVNDPGFGGSFLLPNVDWIQDFQVRGLGAGAEYGNFQGGLVNIVTKSGSNTFQGGVRLNYEDASLNASNINLEEAGWETSSRVEGNAEVRGPLLRDRLYYYASVQQMRRDIRVVDRAAMAGTTPEGVIFQPLIEERSEFKALGKLTWEASPSDIVNLAIGRDNVFVDNAGLGSYDQPEVAYQVESPATFGNLSWQRSFASGNLLQAKVTGYTARNDDLPLGGNQPAIRLLSSPQYQYQNALYTREQAPQNIAANVDYDASLRTGRIAHNLKIGATYGVGWWDEVRRRNAGFSWRPDPGSGEQVDPSDPSTWGFISSDWGGDIGLHAHSVNAALYVQDYIRVTERLNVNAGLRLGYWEGHMDDAAGGRRKVTDALGLAPRVGATFDVLGDDRLVAKAHFGRYYQNMFALMFDRWEGGNVFQDLEYWDWAGPGLPDPNRVYTVAEREQFFDLWRVVPTGQEVGPVVNYSQPYVNQWVVGLQRQITPNWKAEAVYVNRRNHDILALRDVNLATNYTAYHNVAVEDWRADVPVWDQYCTPELAQQNACSPLVLSTLYISNDDIRARGSAPGVSNPDALSWEQDLELTNVDEAERQFHQVQVNAQGRIQWLTVRGSVAWTDLKGNFYSVSGYDDPFGTGAGAFVRPNEQTNFHGALPGFSDWESKLSLTAQLPFQLRAGTFVTYYSGDRYTPRYRIDSRNHDFYLEDGTRLHHSLVGGVDGQMIYLEERGSRTYPAEFLMDIHLDRVFTMPGMMPGNTEWVLGLDVFNLFNTNVVRSLKTTVNGVVAGVNGADMDPTTFFESPRFRTPPRSLRLTTSIRF